MSRIKYAMLCAALTLAATAKAGDAGVVVFSAGTALVAERPAAVDLTVREGDTLTTGPDGYIYVKTVDQGFLILRPNSTARVVQYHIDTASPANTRVKLELLSGVARAISGQGVKQARQNFRFNTPVAAIGVRGTDFVVFTDDHTSRVAVTSGGVVMSGFSSTCAAEGAGPCEGRSSRELFAGQAGLLLQVQRGEAAPRLIDNPQLSPDHTEHARPDEPIAKGIVMPGVAQLNLDPLKDVPVAKPRPAANLIIPPPLQPVPVVQQPDDKPLPPPAPEVFWGRWESVAGLPVDSSQAAGKSVVPSSFVGAYKITRLSMPQLVMPTEGKVGFAYAGGEAVMIKHDAARTAAIEGARLNVDFATRQFDTALTVVSGVDRVNVLGRGDITDTGKMLQTPGSATQIQGYLGGRGATEAAYIFKNETEPGIMVMGATNWTNRK